MAVLRPFPAIFFGNYVNIFHKTEVQTVILRWLPGLNLDWLKSYDSKCKYFSIFLFCDIVEKNAFVFVAVLGFIYVLCHNCCTNHDSDLFSNSKWQSEHFMKDFYIVGTKMARNGPKLAIYQLQILMINL